MSQVSPLPLFPLHVVLFPGLPLPLHIFEPRYRLMIGRCLEASSPFGVVLIRAGREVGDPATPYSVGTTARIVRHERLADGRLNLLCVGRQRFRIRELRTDQPYLAADVEPLTERPTEPEAANLTASLAGRVRSFLGPTAPTLELPADSEALSFAAAALVPLDLAERQALLELTSTAERLRALITCVDREARLRGRVGSTRPASPGMLGDLSPN
ncbi:MAG TPA: LON peptidase substrate-binding domain-containing protein [Chloroflexota bacterium]